MAMNAVDERLVRRDDALTQLLDPPFDKSDLDPGYIRGYVPGVRENGGQYTHAAIWAAMAFAALGELAWSSVPSASLSAAHLGEIIVPSRRKNERNHISGRLLFAGAHFLGVLEGDERDLGKLWPRMARDERHRALIRIGDALCGKRWFPEWMMAYMDHADIGAQIEALRSPQAPPSPASVEAVRSIMLGADSR